MNRKRLIGVIAAALLGVGSALTFATPASAATYGPYALQDLMSPSKCIYTVAAINGYRPYIKGCDYGVWQNWYFDQVAGTSNVYEIRISSGANSCLDVRDWNPNQFAQIQMWDCNHTYNQQFTLTLASTGAAQLRNWSGWCITVEGTYPYDGTPLFMNNCSPELGRNMWWLM